MTSYDAYYNVLAHQNIDPNEYRHVTREYFKQHFADFTIRTLEPERHPLFLGLEYGWLRLHVRGAEESCWGRWEYWDALMTANAQIRGMQFLYQNYAPDYAYETVQIPTSPIPKIEFELQPYPRVLKLIEACLNQIPLTGHWRDGREIEYLHFFCDWLLYGLHHHSVTELPKEPPGCQGASHRLYLTFQVQPFFYWPYDYLGEVLNSIGYFKKICYEFDDFPEPELIEAWMADCGDSNISMLSQFIEPVCLTGRYSLEVSNYSLRVFAQAVDTLLAKVAIINFEFYAPWAARPVFSYYDVSHDVTFWGQELTSKNMGKPLENIPIINTRVKNWLANYRYFSGISDHMTCGASEADSFCLSFTEFDSDNWLDALPLIKRRYIEDIPQLHVFGYIENTLMDVLENHQILEEEEPKGEISYAEALEYFMEYDYPSVVEKFGEDDEIAMCEAWSFYTDWLCKEGYITPLEYRTWDSPF